MSCHLKVEALAGIDTTYRSSCHPEDDHIDQTLPNRVVRDCCVGIIFSVVHRIERNVAR